MGGKSTTSSQSVSIPPEVLARYNAVNARAEQVAQKPFTAYSQDPNAFVAPLSSSQQAAVGNVNQLMGSYAPDIATGQQAMTAGTSAAAPLVQAGLNNTLGAQQQAQGIYQGALGGILGSAQAGQQGNSQAQGYLPGATQNITPMAFSQDAVQQYMSPYMSNVVAAQQALQGQQNAQQRSQMTGDAIRAGAFGGDRAGIALANLGQQQSLANQATLSNLLQQGYGQGLGAFQQQQGVDLSAQQANRAAQQFGAQQSASLGQQQYQQGLGAAQAAAGIGQGIYGMGSQTGAAQQQAGQNLFNIGQQYGQNYANLGLAGYNAGLSGAQAQMGVGQVQQQTDQAAKSALYNQFLQQQGFPYQQSQFLANIAEGTGSLSGSTTTTTQPSGWSDKRLKDNIKKVGKTFDGQNIYAYNLKGDNERRLGLMAQEVEGKHPEAVGLSSGYKTVDYNKATSNAAQRGHFYSGGLVPNSEGGAVIPSMARQGFDSGGNVSPEYLNSVIQQLYQQEFNRQADPAGLAYWQQQMASGVTANQVQQAMEGSSEYKTAHPSNTSTTNTNNTTGTTKTTTPTDYTKTISDLYNSEFGRTPDQSGLQYYQSLMSQGWTADQVKAQLDASSEYKTAHPDGAKTTDSSGRMTLDQAKAYVGSLYSSNLNRSGDTEGTDYWAKMIADGTMSPSQVASSFAASNEKGLVNQTPLTYNSNSFVGQGLGITPNQYGFYSASPAAYGSSFDPSSMVNNMYGAYLGRTSDPSGYGYYTQQLQSGAMSPQTMQSAFANSAEAQGRQGYGGYQYPGGSNYGPSPMSGYNPSGKGFQPSYNSGATYGAAPTNYGTQGIPTATGKGSSSYQPTTRYGDTSGQYMPQQSSGAATGKGPSSGSSGSGWKRGGRVGYAYGGAPDFSSLAAAQQQMYANLPGGQNFERIKLQPGSTRQLMTPSMKLQQPTNSINEAAKMGESIAKLADLGGKAKQKLLGYTDDKTGEKHQGLFDRSPDTSAAASSPPPAPVGGTTTTTTKPAAALEPGLSGASAPELQTASLSPDLTPDSDLMSGLGGFDFAARGGRIGFALGGSKKDDTSDDAPEGMYSTFGQGINIPNKESPYKLNVGNSGSGSGGSGGSNPLSTISSGLGLANAGMSFMEGLSDFLPALLLARGGVAGRRGYATDGGGGLNPRNPLTIDSTAEDVTPDDTVQLARQQLASSATASDANQEEAPIKLRTHKVPDEFMPIIRQEAKKNNIPPELLAATIAQESSFNAKDPKGGLMQIMGSTAAKPGYGLNPISPEDVADPAKNIAFGARYLRARADEAGATDLTNPNHIGKALAAYNGGGDPLYVAHVMQHLPGDRGDAAAAILAQSGRQAAPSGQPSDDKSAAGLVPSARTTTAINPVQRPFASLAKKAGLNVPDELTQSNFWVPLLATIATTMASPRPKFGQALGEGIVGGLSAMSAQDQEQASLGLAEAKTRQANISAARESVIFNKDGLPIFVLATNRKTGQIQQVPFGEVYRNKDQYDLLPSTAAQIEDLARQYPEAVRSGQATTQQPPVVTSSNAKVAPTTSAAIPAPTTPSSVTPQPKPPEAPTPIADNKFALPSERDMFKLDDISKTNLQKFLAEAPTTDLSGYKGILENVTQDANSALEQRPLLIQMAGAYSGLPTKGPLSPGSLGPIVGKGAATINDLARKGGLSEPLNPTDIARVEKLDKIQQQIDQTITSGSGQKSYAALVAASKGRPGFGTSPEGFAGNMSDLIVNAMKPAFKNAFAADWLDTAQKIDPTGGALARSSGRDLDAEFQRQYGPKFDQDRTNLKKMFLTPITQDGKPVLDPQTGRTINYFQFVADHGPDLSKEEKSGIEKKFGKGILSYFGNVTR